MLLLRMGYGDWSEDKRGSYNKWDAISRCTTQVGFGFSFSSTMRVISLRILLKPQPLILFELHHAIMLNVNKCLG